MSDATIRRHWEAARKVSGWDIEYPRDAGRLRNLGITSATATIRFGKIPKGLSAGALGVIRKLPQALRS